MTDMQKFLMWSGVMFALVPMHTAASMLFMLAFVLYF